MFILFYSFMFLLNSWASYNSPTVSMHILTKPTLASKWLRFRNWMESVEGCPRHRLQTLYVQKGEHVRDVDNSARHLANDGYILLVLHLTSEYTNLEVIRLEVILVKHMWILMFDICVLA